MRPSFARAATQTLCLAGWLALGGCAENAILEITVDLPEDDAPGRYAVVRVDSSASETPAFSGEEITFDKRERSLGRLSVVAGGADVELPLWVEVRFCDGVRCDAPGDPDAVEHVFRYERALYLGAYTEHRIDLRDAAAFEPPAEPPGTTMVDRCAVFGCRDGDTPAMSCESVGEELVHFCEL